jgi:colicin import membrane protein
MQARTLRCGAALLSLWACSAYSTTTGTTTAASTPSPELEAVSATVKAWARAWDKGDIPQYLSHYADNYVPPGGSTHQRWLEQRTERLKLSALRQVLLRDLKVVVKGVKAQAQFTQHYLDMYLISTSQKRMSLIKHGNTWKISEERVESERSVPRQAQISQARQ